MEKKFWEEAWEQGNIGFHQKIIHSYLRRFYRRLGIAEGDSVFVPLCGKSLDMVWLQQQGAAVVGVEFSPLAVQAFFEENDLNALRDQQEPFESYSSGNLQLLCGDLFNLSQEEIGHARAVYDRASLVALPKAMRRCYAVKLATLLPSGSRVLLVSYDYDQAEMAGPPFAVSAEELAELFEVDFTIELLAEGDVLESHQVLAERGLTRLSEKAHLLIRK